MMSRPLAIASRPLSTAVLLAASCAVTLTGCSMMPGGKQTEAVESHRFVDLAATTPRTEPVAQGSNDHLNPNTAANDAETDGTSPNGLGEARALPGNAMIGQINGQAIYAHQVLDPIDDRLAALARQSTGNEFERQAARIIADRLRAIIVQNLIVGAAEQSLSPQEQMGLRILVDRKRQELLRKHGHGSPALTNAVLVRETGIGLDQTLELERDKMLVQNYLRQVVRPKVNVSRRDVERYYADNIEQYQQPEKRELRLIIVDNPADRDAVAKRLTDGEAFIEVAKDEVNTFNASSGGAYGEPIAQGGLMSAEAAEAVFEQDPGDHAGPFAVNGSWWFVWTGTVHLGENRSFDDVQLEIRKRIHDQQVFEETSKHRRELWENGSFTEPLRMGERLLEIAIARYKPE